LVVAAILRQSQGLGPFAFAVFAAFGFVLELFIVKKELFTRGEDEVIAAVHTFETLVLELHWECPLSCIHSQKIQKRADASLHKESQK